MRASSEVKMRMRRLGTAAVARKNTAETSRENLSVNASRASTVSLSPFPQYCAANMLAPMVRASINRLKTNCTCPARETAESSV